MLKLLLLITVICLLVECDFVSTKRLKPKTTTWKSTSGGLRKDHHYANRTYSKWEEAKWKDLQKILKLPSNEICAIICDPECIEYVCVDGVCCTPGSPESVCCPLDHPLCIDEFCCAAGHPQICGMYCCEEEEICCPGGCCEGSQACCGVGCCETTDVCCLDHCCETGDLCCGSGCCGIDETCCGGTSCCKQNETCCGNECCSESQTCCTEGGEKKCCNKSTVNSCSSEIHDSKCPSQFDALSCSEKQHLGNISSLTVANHKCLDFSGKGILYRILRPDESCYYGLKAKAIHATESVLSFVNCGSMQGYKSQFISATSSLDVVKSYQAAVRGARIAQIYVNSDLRATCSVVNLANIGERKKHLRNAKSSQFAAQACEYLLTCKARIPCKEL